MLAPKKVKHRKWHTGREHASKQLSPETRGIKLSFGSYGMKSITYARITSNQIESARKVLVRELGKTGKVWIRIFPDWPITQKPPEVKLGKGKGDPVAFVTRVYPGRIIFEVDGVETAVAKKAIIKAGKKLPVTVKVVGREITI